MNQPFADTKKTFDEKGKEYSYYSLPVLAKSLQADLSRLPYAIRILLESCLRNHIEKGFSGDAVPVLAKWHSGEMNKSTSIPFLPARILLQDYTGLPVLNDLTALRAAMKRAGKNPKIVNPSIPIDLVIDHSVQVQAYGCERAREINEEREFTQNYERYEFLKWAENSYDNLKVLPPGLGICHQVNLEYLGRIACIKEEKGVLIIYPDTVMGCDSHTTMVNGLGILGWGVGGIEALAALLGYPSEMAIPEVIGVRLTGKLPANTTPTDLTLTLTSKLREFGVVGKFVELFGASYADLPVETRAMISNMTPESGATTTYCPVDDKTLDYMQRTGRDTEHIKLTASYFKMQRLFLEPGDENPDYSAVVEFNLNAVEPVLSGPKRPQDIFPAAKASSVFMESLSAPVGHQGFGLEEEEIKQTAAINLNGETYEIGHGAVLIAAITSCTNTSNPYVIIAAGLLARNAAKAGLTSKPWVKTSFAPGSRVVQVYLEAANLLEPLEALGFHIVGYGCTSCIGNSGPLADEVRQAVIENNLVGASVLSGNRNFEARIHPYVRANYLASPPLVIAYALAGKMDFNFEKTPLGIDSSGKDIFLRDIYPSQEEIDNIATHSTHAQIYSKNYVGLYESNERWNAMMVPDGDIFPYNPKSAMISEPDFLFNDGPRQTSMQDIVDARVLAFLGDSITTDHISPAGPIAPEITAGIFLQSQGVSQENFITFGARRGSHELMHRGTFSNPRLRNRLADEKTGGFTTHFPSGELLSIYDAAERYIQDNIPLVILAGKAYGPGSSRDWAAKGPYLLGVRAVIAESFERIHRTNLISMGVLPLQYKEGDTAEKLGLTGREQFTLRGMASINKLNTEMKVLVNRPDGSQTEFNLIARIETPLELAYFQAGGLARKLLADL